MQKLDEKRVRIKTDIENMLVSLDILDGQLRDYTRDPQNAPRPDYERYNQTVLNYENLHRDAWSNDLRYRYDRVLEKRQCYEDSWMRWFEDASLQYWKAGAKL
ncbi:MAG: hypothetical protein SWQ30_04930 [Thermodesulfobacteriota bacterium]|nr:hypothetical protein [Thermodesulfobacteriota bacterium]